MRPTHYEYQVVFAGNRGHSFAPHDRLYRDKDEAREAARRLDGHGLRYGARIRRVRVAN